MEDIRTISIDKKVDELISLMETSALDLAARKRIQQKFNTALRLNESAGMENDSIHNFFQKHKTDTRKSRSNRMAMGAVRVARMIAALLLVVLGFGMIIMPAPPYFEMFTLFYINANDGVTIMDVISLIVAFIGVSLFISSIIKFNK